MVRNIFAVVILIAGTILAGYVGIYLLFIKAILTVCAAYDEGTLSAMIVGVSIIKIVLATTVSTIIFAVSIVVSQFVAGK